MTPLWTHLFFDLGDCQPPAFANVASLKLPSTCYPVWITAIDIVSLAWKVLSRSSDSLLHTTSKMNRSQAVKNGYQLNPSLFCGLLMQAFLLDFLGCPFKTQHSPQTPINKNSSNMVVLVLTPVSTFWFNILVHMIGGKQKSRRCFFQLALRSRRIFSWGKNPNSICDPTSPPELKWVAGVAWVFWC